MKRLIPAIIALPLLLWGAGAIAGDAAAGKATFDEKCAECHYPDDFEGESVDAIAGFIGEVKSGAAEHKDKVVTEISDEEAANIAAFWASGAK